MSADAMPARFIMLVRLWQLIIVCRFVSVYNFGNDFLNMIQNRVEFLDQWFNCFCDCFYSFMDHWSQALYELLFQLFVHCPICACIAAFARSAWSSSRSLIER